MLAAVSSRSPAPAADEGIVARLVRPCSVVALFVAVAACEPSEPEVPRNPSPNSPWAPGYVVPPSPYGPTRPSRPLDPSDPWAAGPPGQVTGPPAPLGRRIDTTLDGTERVPPAVDVRDPFFEVRDGTPRAAASASAATVPPAPSTHVLVLLALEKKGNTAGRLAAVRAFLSSRGAVKRTDVLWEIPAPEADRTPEALRVELRRLLCDEDRATLFYGGDRAMHRLELAGQSACESAR